MNKKTGIKDKGNIFFFERIKGTGLERGIVVERNKVSVLL